MAWARCASSGDWRASGTDKTGGRCEDRGHLVEVCRLGRGAQSRARARPAVAKAGQTVWVRAVARDRRQLDLPDLKLGPQESATPWLPIHIVASEAKAKAELAQLESLRTALAKILQDQLRARAAAAGLPRLATEAEAGKVATDIRGQQVGVQKAATAVIASIGATDEPDRLTIKRVVSKLALGEMVQAVRQAEALEHVRAVTELAKPTAELTATQDRIVDVLRRLLNEIRKESADLLAEMKKRPDTQLPSDVKDKLRDLKDKLDEFLKQQKKVIEATENLAKKPVEDFTEKEKQLLKDLAATEDEWAKFMADKHTDLSKLPEQDFANPEPAQGAGRGPDRAEDGQGRPDQEDGRHRGAAGAARGRDGQGDDHQHREVAPRHARPREMEPGRAAHRRHEGSPDGRAPQGDGGHRGQADGGRGRPVRRDGRRLQQLGRLAGQGGRLGRDGRPDLEQQRAGRDRQPAAQHQRDRRPQRRGPAGQVERRVRRRHGRGQGGPQHPQPAHARRVREGPDQGLQQGPGRRRHRRRQGERRRGRRACTGPLPNRTERDLGRLATKQAQLRNKAEGVDLKFQVIKYHHTDLKRMIDVMAAVEADLKSGRYRSALRRRDVLLEGLGQVKTYLKGEFSVRQDQSANLPTDIQKEILGNMQEPSPPGWEELNRQYFERLTSAPGSGRTATRQAWQQHRSSPACRDAACRPGDGSK